MYLKLNDEFLNQYHIRKASSYNTNYYKLPFSIICDGYDYNVLCIVYDDASNEYRYSLCYDLEEDENLFVDSRYIIPSPANENYYKIDLDNYSKDMIWL
ncbi:hypothetical protein [Clostridium perfringens]|uniref:hypothetical protein n=1 Tax=Clostridium perfringens TaxID=1502 RepID=UPI0037499FDD